MRISCHRRNTHAFAALFALVGCAAATPALLAQVAGADRGLSGLAPAGAASPEGAIGPAGITKARSLSDEGRLILARDVIARVLEPASVDRLSPLERGQAVKVLKNIDTKINAADPVEMSLQKAELALSQGDLVVAERHAQAAASNQLDVQQRSRAEALSSGISSKRTELAPSIPNLIDSARANMDRGEYAKAKRDLTTVLRSGVELTPAQAEEVSRQQMKVVEIETSTGKTLAIDDPNAGVQLNAQPGTVRRPGRPEPLPAVAGTNDAPAASSGMGALESTLAQSAAGERAPAASAPVAQPASAQPASGSDSQPAYIPPAPMPNMPAPSGSPAPAQQSAPADDLVTQAMRAEAYRLIVEADQAFDQARYTVAVDKYSLALSQFRSYLSPADADRAEKRIAEARARMGQGIGGGDLKDQVVRNESLVRQRASSEFDTFITQAQQRLASGETDKAQDLLAQARLSIARARSSFNDAEFGAFQARLDALGASIGAKRDEIAKNEASRRETELKEKAGKAEASRLAERDRKVNESIDRVRALQQERKYEKALQVADQALFLDPNNPTALLLRDILRDIVVYQKYNEIQANKQYQGARQALDNAEATLVPSGAMNFPAEWPAKSLARGEQAAFSDTLENRRVLSQMASSKVELKVENNKLQDVLSFISTVTQLSIDADWDSLATVGVDKDSEVTLRLPPIPVDQALTRVLSKVAKDQFARAGWSVDAGIITIASEEQLRKTRSLVIYDIKDLLFEIPNYRVMPQIDLNSVLQQSQGGSGQSPFNNDQNNQVNPEEAERRRRERIRAIIDIIYANVDFEGWKDNGGETGSLQELNGSLIITNTPRNHREIVGLLSKLREIRNMQINVETKFLLVNQQWFEQIGFDLDIVFNANSNIVRNSQAVNPSVLPSSFFDFAGGAGRTLGFQPNGTTTGITPARVGRVDNLSPVGAQSGSRTLTSALSEGDFASQVLGRAPALGIAGQFLDDIQVDFLITATQADKRTVRLTAPRLTFTNGQTANIYVVTQQAFVSGLTPIVGDSAVGFNPRVSVLSEGVTMLVEGVISSDRRYVTLSIDSGVARLDRLRQSSVSAVAGGQLVNSANTQSFVELPQITVTRVRTTVTVPDEGTVLLGGQRLITEVEVETGVPVLSKIPIINRFFTNRLESREEQTLLILVKPTILIQSEQEEKAHPGVGDAIRTGLTPLR